MNKTFTLALAAASIAGMICAEIATPPAGYVEVAGTSSAKFVANPFLSFDNGAATTLADIDGSFLGENATIKLYNAKGKVTATYYWLDAAAATAASTTAGWNTKEDTTYTYAGNTTLTRGDAISFKNGENTDGQNLVFAGTLTDASRSVTCVKGQNYVGNVSPVAKTLSAFSVAGSFDPWSDYVVIGSTKYVYDSGHWYLRDAFLSDGDLVAQDSLVTIAAGTGFRVYTPSAAGTTVSLPGGF